MVLILAIKHQVKEVLADERDYEMSGKAARYSLGIFSTLMSVVVFILMFLRDVNPLYETISSILAYAVCGQLLMYSFIFQYLNSGGIKKYEK